MTANPSMPSGARNLGFTLLELMVTVAVVAILVAVAYPSMTGLLNGQRLSGVTNELLGGFQTARSEAIRRNARVAFCRSADGTTCAGSTGVWTNWVIMADSTGNGVPDELVKAATIKTPVLVNSAAIVADTVLFRPDGLARESAGAAAPLLNADIKVCIVTTNPPENVRVLTIAGGSRVTISRPPVTCP